MRSLSERVADLAALAPSASESIDVIYTRLFREAFGRKPFIASRQRTVLERVERDCAANGTDVETHIAGNLWAMSRWVAANPRIGFQPMHLCGENALRRYHAYLGRLARRFRHARHDGSTGETPAANLRRQLFLGEYSVGEEFTARFMQDGCADWDGCVRDADPNRDWLALERGKESHYHRACNLFGAPQLRVEREYARLRAAAAIAETYQHGLADRIGFTHFTWQSFAELVRRVVEPREKSRVTELAEVEGLAWH